MINLSPEIITLIMFGGLLVGLLTGFPLAVVIGGVALIVGYAVWGGTIGEVLYTRSWAILLNYTILAVPLFVFMGAMLEHSGIAERLYDVLYLWLGGLRGGLAIVTVLIGTIMAACVGIIAASTSMLALVALPSMVKRGYSKSLAAGSVCAGGTLGILIPPSIMLVLYGPMSGVSVGKLFFGAFIPGFVLSGLYVSYIALRSLVQPKVAPPVPVEERGASFLKKTAMLIMALVPPAILVMSVLGVIFMGIAAPTEAAGIGAFAAALLALAYHRLNLPVLKEVTLLTFRLSGFILLIGTMSFAFVGVFIGAGCDEVVKGAILGAPGGRWGAFAIIMFICFILGMFIDWVGIVFIMVPIITPIGAALGFDPLWFAMMICVNLQMSFMTPPFAWAIFIVRGTAAKELGVTMGDIIHGVIPFVILIMVGLVLCIAFPELILWLPGMMIK
ncbi:MAG TPA: TRAP transporter large permease subunit [Dehalococcoidales bacterium]|nr:TRAP transporter large permease subunit [Dehalococcoidales bacterium]